MCTRCLQLMTMHCMITHGLSLQPFRAEYTATIASTTLYLVSLYHSDHLVLSHRISRLLVPRQQHRAGDAVAETLQRLRHHWCVYGRKLKIEKY